LGKHRTRVALLGFGTVGSAVARRLTSRETPDNPSHEQIALTHIFDRRAEEKRRQHPSTAVVWTSRVEDVLQSDADIVIEAVGGIDAAADWVRGALAAGKSVVTANKQLVAHQGVDLWALASRQGRQFRFEAAVGGAMPIVRAIADGMAGDRIQRIEAILNGTTNAVLSSMGATGCSMDEALADARRCGYAEADPSADLSGEDARAKLAILCGLAFHVRVDPLAIPIRTVESLTPSAWTAARAAGGTIRQVAFARFDRRTATLTARVGPAVVPRDSLLGRTTGPQNAAIVTGEYSGQFGIFGTGAGGDATAVAILGDVRAIARDRAAIVPPPTLTRDFRLQTADCKLISDFRFLNSDVDLFDLSEAV
jgi:homoserine dehydrogenase